MSISAGYVVSPQQAETLHGLFIERVRRTPDKEAYRHFDARQQAWRAYTWRDALDEVARWQEALRRENLKPGDRVAIMLRNCPEWVFFDQAALSLGLVVVPLYTVDRPDNVAYIVKDAGVKVLLFENRLQWLALSEVREQLAGVQRFVALEDLPCEEDGALQSARRFLPESAELLPPVTHDADALATIIYTSGTTGKPKGVMLSHRNILENAHASLGIFTVTPDDLFLSFLPLSHAFERTLGYYLTVMTGATVAFARSIAQLSEDLQSIRPTLLISVPRIYERIWSTIRSKLDEGPPLRKKLFFFAVAVGWARFLHQQGRGPWRPSFLLWPLLDKLVASKVLQRLGGRLRTAISGGAALSPEISRVFVGLGLPVVQGYGLTETSPVISGNPLDHNFPETVGLPIPGVEVKIGENDALIVKGPNVMLGYWNNPEATRAMISPDGWLNTGDTARIAPSGHITLTGRLKEIIVMSNGEKMPPADMEAAILRDPLFEQVMVYGEARPYLVALAVINRERWPAFAAEVGVHADMPEAYHDVRVEQAALQRIVAQLHEFPGYARIRRVLLLEEPWSIENDLLTPTLKLKRARAVARYAAEIEKLYKGH